MFVVTVQFELKQGTQETFLTLMLENAKASEELEPGCLQFDVCTNPETPDQIFLYEVYADSTAFKAHLAMPHFKSFDEATGNMIAAKSIKTLTKANA